MTQPPEPVRDLDGPSRGFIVLCAIVFTAFVVTVAALLGWRP